jgi:hypothetical protein
MKNPIIAKIPYLNLPDQPIVDSSQQFVPIADITDDIVLFKDGGASLILESSSLNFSLLSEKEQQAVIVAYGALLNSLSFPIQIIVRSQIKDITKYLDYVAEARAKIQNPKLLIAIDSYKNFIEETVKKKNVLGKNFFIVIPFSPLELGVTKSAATVTKKKKGALPFAESFVVRKAKVSLYPKRDHLIRQGARLGLRLKQLQTEELIKLYYTLFNAPPPAIIRKEI